jgi:protein-tyrosine kinase
MLSTKVRNADRSIGAILIDAGRLTPADAERILQYQQQSELRFGEAGVELGLMTEADILYALSLQFDYPFIQPGGSNPISPEVVAACVPCAASCSCVGSMKPSATQRWPSSVAHVARGVAT